MTDTLTLDDSPTPAKPAPKLTLEQAVFHVANLESQRTRQRSLLPEEAQGIAKAFSTKGKGLLLANAPSEPWARAAWNGLQPNPFKVQIGAVLFLPDGPRDFCTWLSSNVKLPAAADRDAGALQRLGVW